MITMVSCTNQSRMALFNFGLLPTVKISPPTIDSDFKIIDRLKKMIKNSFKLIIIKLNIKKPLPKEHEIYLIPARFNRYLRTSLHEENEKQHFLSERLLNSIEEERTKLKEKYIESEKNLRSPDLLYSRLIWKIPQLKEEQEIDEKNKLEFQEAVISILKEWRMLEEKDIEFKRNLLNPYILALDLITQLQEEENEKKISELESNFAYAYWKPRQHVVDKDYKLRGDKKKILKFYTEDLIRNHSKTISFADSFFLLGEEKKILEFYRVDVIWNHSRTISIADLIAHKYLKLHEKNENRILYFRSIHLEKLRQENEKKILEFINMSASRSKTSGKSLEKEELKMLILPMVKNFPDPEPFTCLLKLEYLWLLNTPSNMTKYTILIGLSCWLYELYLLMFVCKIKFCKGLYFKNLKI